MSLVQVLGFIRNPPRADLWRFAHGRPGDVLDHFGMRIYRLETGIVERDGIFHVRAAARLGTTLQGTIAQERQCDSRQAAEITQALLIDQIHAAVKAIGAALDLASVNALSVPLSEGDVG